MGSGRGRRAESRGRALQSRRICWPRGRPGPWFDASSGGCWSDPEVVRRACHWEGRRPGRGQKVPPPRARLCRSLAAAITRQEPWMMKGPRGTLELFSSDRKKLGGKSVMLSEDRQLLSVSLRMSFSCCRRSWFRRQEGLPSLSVCQSACFLDSWGRFDKSGL